MAAVAPIAQRQVAQPLPEAQVSSFTQEKITRLALKALALLGEVARIFLCAYILTGGISLWHIFTVLGLSAALTKCWDVAKNIVDLNDPNEVRELGRDFPGLSITDMLERYPIETILRHNLVHLDTLRCRFATGSKTEPEFAKLRPHADALLAATVITPAMHQFLQANDLLGLRQLMPNNSIDLARMFQA
jgi:hypothetical protein